MRIRTYVHSLQRIGGCIVGEANWNMLEVVPAIVGVLTFDTIIFTLTIIRVLKTSKYGKLYHVAEN